MKTVRVGAGQLVVVPEILPTIRFGENGLLPAVVVDRDGVVLMVAYMDAHALDLTLETGRTWFYSRSRSTYWAKGESSGNIQRVLEIRTDCDRDTLLVTVEQVGEGACHTGAYSCFFEAVASLPEGNE